MTLKSGGLSDNGVKALVDTILGLQAAIIKAEKMAKQKVSRVGKVKRGKKKFKTGQKLSKIKEGKGFDVFDNLNF